MRMRRMRRRMRMMRMRMRMRKRRRRKRRIRRPSWRPSRGASEPSPQAYASSGASLFASVRVRHARDARGAGPHARGFAPLRRVAGARARRADDAPSLRDENRKKTQTFFNLLLMRFESLAGARPLPTADLDVLATPPRGDGADGAFLRRDGVPRAARRCRGACARRYGAGETGWPPGAASCCSSASSRTCSRRRIRRTR